MSAVNPQDPVNGPDEEGAPMSEPVPERISFTSPPALMTAVVLSAVTLMFSLYGWYAIGADIRSQINWLQAATLLFFIFVMIAIMLSIGYSRLWADEKGVTIRNGPVLRKFTVDQIAGLRLRSGDAWAYLLIKDGNTVRRRAVLAVQHLEGARARKKMHDLRAWLKAHGATSKDVTQPED